MVLLGIVEYFPLSGAARGLSVCTVRDGVRRTWLPFRQNIPSDVRSILPERPRARSSILIRTSQRPRHTYISKPAALYSASRTTICLLICERAGAGTESTRRTDGRTNGVYPIATRMEICIASVTRAKGSEGIIFAGGFRSQCGGFISASKFWFLSQLILTSDDAPAQTLRRARSFGHLGTSS